MSTPYTICGIDIGNSSLKVALAALPPHGEVPEVIGVGSVPSGSALRAGEIVDMKETTELLRQAIGQASTMAGVPVRRAYIGVSGLDIASQISKGTIAVAKSDGEITQSDIDRVIATAQVVSLPPNRQIIHVIPREFIIDGTEHVRDPLGMKGVRLEADVLLVHSLSRHLKNLSKCVNECGVEDSGFVFAPIAASMTALDKHAKEFGVAHLDFGGGTASLSVWDQSDLVHSAILPLGSRHITNDLAIALRTSLECAERIKMQMGVVNEHFDRRRKPETVDLTAMLEEPFIIERRQLVGVMDERARELMERVRFELVRAGRDGKLPAGVVVSGGGAKLEGFLSLAKEMLGLPVRPAKVHGVEAFEAAMDPAFSVAVGLVAWGFAREAGMGIRSEGPSAISGALGHIKGWLKTFVP